MRHNLVLYDVSHLGLRLERDQLFRPHVVILPELEQHVSTELVPIHETIARRIQLCLNNIQRVFVIHVSGFYNHYK